MLRAVLPHTFSDNIITPVTFRAPLDQDRDTVEVCSIVLGNEMWTGIKTRMWSRDSEGATI